jgi:F-type H+-transporting ATPase subunit gamma
MKRIGVERVLLVVITSDKGLAGSVNSAVLKKVEQFRATNVPFDVVAVGRKAVEFAGREKIKTISTYTNIGDEVTIADVNEITKIVTGAFRDSMTYQKVEVIYQNFISTFEQEPTMRQILPLDPAEVHFIMRGIRPRTGKFSEDITPADAVIDHTVEPSTHVVFDSLIPQLVQIIIFHAFLESKACEHSARMVAMKNATDKSKEVAKALTLVYNKARQAAITAEVAEITGGMEAMK